MTMPQRFSRLSPVWLCLAAVFALALLLRYPVADVPLERDEGEYAYIAQRWLLGEIPYKESFDQKPPGAFVAYALFQSTLGTSPAALHWGAQLYTLATLTLVLLLGRKLFSLAVGTAAAALVAFMTTDPSVYGNAANTETFMILPLAAGLLTTLRAVERDSVGWAFATGLLAAAALLCKQVALFNVLLFFGWIVWHARRRWLLTASVTLGTAALLLATFGYFVAQGAGRAFYDCVIGYNLAYASRVPLRDYPAAFWPSFRELLSSFWPIYLAAVVGLLALVRRRREPLLVGLWLLTTLAVCATGGQFFAHYFIPTLLPTALFAGLGLARLSSPRGAMFLVALTAACVVWGVAHSSWYYLMPGEPGKCRRVYHGPALFDEAPAVARFLADHSSPSDTVFVVGSEPEMYYYAERKCAGRYIFVYPLLTPFAGTVDRQREALEELRRERPSLIVTVFSPASLRLFPRTPPDYLDGVRRTLDESYRVLAVMPFENGEHRPMLTGDEAERFQRGKPTWFDRIDDPAKRSASLVVWRRTAP